MSVTTSTACVQTQFWKKKSTSQQLLTTGLLIWLYKHNAIISITSQEKPHEILITRREVNEGWHYATTKKINMRSDNTIPNNSVFILWQFFEEKSWCICWRDSSNFANENVYWSALTVASFQCQCVWSAKKKTFSFLFLVVLCMTSYMYIHLTCSICC